MSFSSDEVNFLIYRYLQESGKRKVVHICGPFAVPGIHTQPEINVSFCFRVHTFGLHVWDRIAYLAKQHKWGVGAVGGIA